MTRQRDLAAAFALLALGLVAWFLRKSDEADVGPAVPATTPNTADTSDGPERTARRRPSRDDPAESAPGGESNEVVPPEPFAGDRDAAPAVSALDVTVLDGDGNQLSGAEIEVRRGAAVVATARTDTSGHALVGALDGGVHAVTVRAAGWPRVVQFHAIEERRAKRVVIRLRAAGMAIEGTVVDDAGRPVAGMRVEAFRPSWDAAYRELPESGGEELSDAEGRFRIEGLREGRHELWAQEFGRPVSGQLSGVAAPAAGVRLVSVRRATLRFRLVPPEGSAPPPALYVHIGSLVHEPKWTDGPVEIAGLDPGTETVEFRIAGYVPIDRDVKFVAGEVADLGEIALDAGWELRGRVEDPSGQPVPQAAVQFGDSFAPDFQDVKTDAAGSFQLEHLPAGEVEIRVSASGFLGGRMTTVRVGRGEGEARVVLVRGGLLRGTVRRSDGTMAAGVFVHMFDKAAKDKDEDMDDREAFERIDSSGTFEVRLLAGRYRVEVERKLDGRQGVVAQADVDLAEGATVPLVIDLPE